MVSWWWMPQMAKPKNMRVWIRVYHFQTNPDLWETRLSIFHWFRLKIAHHVERNELRFCGIVKVLQSWFYLYCSKIFATGGKCLIIYTDMIWYIYNIIILYIYIIYIYIYTHTFYTRSTFSQFPPSYHFMSAGPGPGGRNAVWPSAQPGLTGKAVNLSAKLKAWAVPWMDHPGELLGTKAFLMMGYWDKPSQNWCRILKGTIHRTIWQNEHTASISGYHPGAALTHSEFWENQWEGEIHHRCGRRSCRLQTANPLAQR